MSNHKIMKDSEDFKHRNNFIKQQEQLKAMKASSTNKVLSADSMIEDLLSKKETFQKKKDSTSAGKLQSGPPWLNPDNHSIVHPLYEKVWNLVKKPLSHNTGIIQHELADTSTLSNLLMTSGLATDILGFIWSLANNTVPGSLTQQELYSVLALVALAQNNYMFNNVSILNQLPNPPLPKLDLSVVSQLKTNFTTSGTTAEYPSLTSNIGNQSAIGVNYFSQSTMVEVKKSVNGNIIVPLDVNQLQSAPVLGLQNNFHIGPVVSPLQNLNLLQSPMTSTPSNLGVTSVSTNVGISSQNILPQQSTGGVLNQLPVAMIPSISLGISSPKSTSIRPIEIVSSIMTTGFETHDNISSLQSTIPVENVNSPSSPNVTNLVLESKIIENLNKGETEIKDDSFNVDESFDSLSTERAITTSLPITGSSLNNKSNYDIDLFNSCNDVRQIFPNTDRSTSIYNECQDNDGDHFVMHNPVYFNDDEHVTSSKSNVVCKRNSEVISNDLDDEFSDFQSADFTTFNEHTVKNHSEINDKIVTNDVSYDNFSDFQQASSDIPVVHNIDGLSTGSLNLFTPSDDDLFPNLPNLKYNSSSTVEVKQLTSTDIKIPNSISSDYTEITSSGSLNDFNATKKDTEKDLVNRIDSKSNNNCDGSKQKDDKIVSPSLNFSSSSSILSGNNYLSNEKDVRSRQVEDKYSALRMLEISTPSPSDDNNNDPVVNDDFGDFVAADISEPGQLQLPDISATSPVGPLDDSSIQIKCLQACLDVLEKSYDILISASTPQILKQVLSDPRGSAHITCLLEVYKVSERLMQHVDSGSLVARVQSIWNTITPYVDSSKHKQMEETVGPVCDLCKCNYGPSPVRYGLNTYHAPCANLYLHYVNPVLPTASN